MAETMHRLYNVCQSYNFTARSDQSTFKALLVVLRALPQNGISQTSQRLVAF